MAVEKVRKVKVVNKDSAAGFAFFVAWIGAAIYFVQLSEGFWGFLLAILKSFVWPAYVLHAILGLLHVS